MNEASSSIAGNPPAVKPFRGENLVGRIFGRWRVVSFDVSINYKPKWICICECGRSKSVTSVKLKSGESKSCGCLSREITRLRSFRHGMSHKREHNIWCGLVSRCSNSSVHNWKDYGGRGISVCERWLGDDGFENFSSDMGPCPHNGTVERRDVNGNYEPDNCYWATRKQQARNKRNNVMLSFNGRTQCASAWAEEIGMSYPTIIQRITILKWSVEKTLTTPQRIFRKRAP